MSENAYANVISNMFIAASKANSPVNGDYIGEDGFLYCGKCNTKKQSKITVLGKEYKPACMCSCRTEELELEKREQEEAEREYYRKLKQKASFPDKKTGGFTFEQDDRRNAEASRITREYVESFDLNSRWLLLNGDCGTGKTFFAACICNAVVNKGFSSTFTTISEVERQLWDAENKNAVYEELTGVDLLVLDDFGAERSTDYMTDISFNIIDGRLRSGKPLVITTNLSSGELGSPKDRNQKRIFSRLYENSIIYTVTGMDRRKEKLKILSGARM